VESLQDKSSNHFYTVVASGGVTTDKNGDATGGSGGVNANISKSSSKWVTEQTSLTGGSVDIYVANKTILSGAVIASDIDKLKLDTGTLEYKNIKDRDRGSNFGGGGNISGGAAPNSNSQSVSVSYGFTDKRQTNFATIGEGEITVMDGKTDLSKLNRDTSISQYNTKDGGLQGGFTVDIATVDLVAHPVDTVVNTAKAVEKGIDDGKAIVVDASERTVNCYKSVNSGDGLTWENNDQRMDRLAEKLLFNDKAEYASGQVNDESGASLIKTTDSKDRNIDDKLVLITDPEKMGQSSAELKKTVGEVFDEIRDDDSRMKNTIAEFDELAQGYIMKAQICWKEIDPTGEKYGDHELSKSEIAYLKENDPKSYQLYQNAVYYSSLSIDSNIGRERTSAVLNYIKTEDRNTIINDTVKNLCNVEAYWEYGTAVGKEGRTFKLYYGDELTKGRIGSVIDGKANAYWGTGGYEWAKKYHLDLRTSSRQSYKVPMTGTEIKDRLDGNITGYALIYKDGRDDGIDKANHYSVIKKGNDGVWYDYDHNRKTKPIPVDFSKVYKIIQE